MRLSIHERLDRYINLHPRPMVEIPFRQLSRAQRDEVWRQIRQDTAEIAARTGRDVKHELKFIEMLLTGAHHV